MKKLRIALIIILGSILIQSCTCHHYYVPKKEKKEGETSFQRHKFNFSVENFAANFGTGFGIYVYPTSKDSIDRIDNLIISVNIDGVDLVVDKIYPGELYESKIKYKSFSDIPELYKLPHQISIYEYKISGFNYDFLYDKHRARKVKLKYIIEYGGKVYSEELDLFLVKDYYIFI